MIYNLLIINSTTGKVDNKLELLLLKIKAWIRNLFGTNRLQGDAALGVNEQKIRKEFEKLSKDQQVLKKIDEYLNKVVKNE